MYNYQTLNLKANPLKEKHSDNFIFRSLNTSFKDCVIPPEKAAFHDMVMNVEFMSNQMKESKILLVPSLKEGEKEMKEELKGCGFQTKYSKFMFDNKDKYERQRLKALEDQKKKDIIWLKKIEEEKAISQAQHEKVLKKIREKLFESHKVKSYMFQKRGTNTYLRRSKLEPPPDVRDSFLRNSSKEKSVKVVPPKNEKKEKEKEEEEGEEENIANLIASEGNSVSMSDQEDNSLNVLNNTKHKGQSTTYSKFRTTCFQSQNRTCNLSHNKANSFDPSINEQSQETHSRKEQKVNTRIFYKIKDSLNDSHTAEKNSEDNKDAQGSLVSLLEKPPSLQHKLNVSLSDLINHSIVEECSQKQIIGEEQRKLHCKRNKKGTYKQTQLKDLVNTDKKRKNEFQLLQEFETSIDTLNNLDPFNKFFAKFYNGENEEEAKLVVKKFYNKKEQKSTIAVNTIKEVETLKFENRLNAFRTHQRSPIDKSKKYKEVNRSVEDYEKKAANIEFFKNNRTLFVPNEQRYPKETLIKSNSSTFGNTNRNSMLKSKTKSLSNFIPFSQKCDLTLTSAHNTLLKFHSKNESNTRKLKDTEKTYLSDVDVKLYKQLKKATIDDYYKNGPFLYKDINKGGLFEGNKKRVLINKMELF